MSFTPGIVTFNAQAFAAAYPAFAFLPQETLTNNFTLATMLLGNSYCSVVQDAPTRANLLNLITAHVTALLNGAWGKPPSGAVGRVISGTEGSVTAQIEWSSAVGKTQVGTRGHSKPRFQRRLSHARLSSIPSQCRQQR